MDGCTISNDVHIRTVKLRVGDNKFNGNSLKYLVRPIHKIQLLFENDKVRFPDGETEDKYNKMMNHLEGSDVLMLESCELER